MAAISAFGRDMRNGMRWSLVKLLRRVPLALLPGGRAKGVTIANRISNILFGSPNWRRGCGVISARCELSLAASALIVAFGRLFGNSESPCLLKSAPVFALDRRGVALDERLPRIWLSERAYNTGCDNGRRVFAECYPAGPDAGGALALELADGCIGEGRDRKGVLTDSERIECFKAAEILLMHAVMRGNRVAAARLAALYCSDLCDGSYWQPYMVERSRHSVRRCASSRGKASSSLKRAA